MGSSPWRRNTVPTTETDPKRTIANGMDVSSAAYKVSYESPSQFSREYRRLFGVPPKQDIAVLRGPAS